MTPEQRQTGLKVGIEIFRFGFYLFIVATLILLYILEDKLTELLWQLSLFLISIGITISIFFRGDSKEKGGYFTKFFPDIFIPFKYWKNK